MGRLIICSNCPNEVIILNVSPEQEKKLEEQYDDDTEVWLSEESIEDKLGISMSDCTYMWMDEGVSVKEITI